jgi:hypothetical protein
MADDDQKIKLGLEVFGLEGLEEAGESFEKLKDTAKGTVDPLQAAVEALAKTGTVVEDLKEKIEQLKKQHEELNTARKAELITEERYKSESDLLVKSLAEKETILKRLTSEEKAAEEQSRRIEKAAQDEAAALAKITKALSDLEAEEERELIQAVKLAESHAKVMESANEVAGTGDGEGGTGGFAGAAAGALKFERAATGLATGHGLRGATRALEDLIGTLGGPAGFGLAIGAVVTAIDVMIPKLESWYTHLTDVEGAAKKATKAIEEHAAAAQKFREAQTPAEKTQEQAIEEFLTAEGKPKIAEGIKSAYLARILPQAEEAAQQRFEETGTHENYLSVGEGGRLMGTWAEKVGQDIDRLIATIGTDRGTQAYVTQLATERPGAFPAEFGAGMAELTPEARARAKEEDLKIDEEDAERQGRKQARFEKAKEFNKKAKEQLERDDVLADLEAEESDPDQQFMLRQHGRREEHNRQVDEWNQQLRDKRHADRERKRIETESRKHTPEAEESAQLKAEREDIMAQLRALNEANVKAGGMPATPQFLRRAEAGAVRAREQGYGLNQAVDLGLGGAQQTEAQGRGRVQAEEAVREVNQQRGLGLSASQVEHIAGDALNRLPATGGNGAMAIQQAIMAAYQRGLQMQKQDMNRMGVFTESFLQ